MRAPIGQKSMNYYPMGCTLAQADFKPLQAVFFQSFKWMVSKACTHTHDD